MNVTLKALVSIRDMRLCCKGCEHWVDTFLKLGCRGHTRSESEKEQSLGMGRRVNAWDTEGFIVFLHFRFNYCRWFECDY